MTRLQRVLLDSLAGLAGIGLACFGYPSGWMLLLVSVLGVVVTLLPERRPGDRESSFSIDGCGADGGCGGCGCGD